LEFRRKKLFSSYGTSGLFQSVSIFIITAILIIIVIIISSFYSSVEHRARVKIHHLVLFAAKAFTSAQLFFSGFNSFSTVRRHLVLGRPLFLVPCGFHSSDGLVILLGAFLNVSPIHFHLFFLIPVDMGFG
jgi:hypothetical protein